MRDLWYKDAVIYCLDVETFQDGNGDGVGDGGSRMHMLFDFLLNQRVFLALARQDRTPLVEGLHLAPEIPERAQWAVFLRNHDELDLGRLTEAQREYVCERFAPDEAMRLYGRGIRRRLAPMLEGDPERLRLGQGLPAGEPARC